MSELATSLARRRGYWLYLAAAAVLPLITSAVWYVVFGKTWLSLRGLDPDTTMRPEVWPMVGQLVRNAVVVSTLAILARRLRITSVAAALQLGLLLWLGFEAMAILGSVLHEQYPIGLYLIHVGDALQATLLMIVLVSLASGRSAS